jgi:hypothetical protein
MNSRKLKSATYKTSLPVAPDGQYVVIQYDSSFEHMAYSATFRMGMLGSACVEQVPIGPPTKGTLTV